MKNLLINSNKNNMSLALVWCQAREKTEPLIGRRESKEKSTEKMNWCQERERIDALLSRLENKEKSAGKMNSSQARERTELLFNRLKNMLLASNTKYSIPVCEERKARENEVVTRAANMLRAPNVNKYWNLCKGEKRG